MLSRLVPLLCRRAMPLQLSTRSNFSQFFEKQDFNELKEMFNKKYRKDYVHYQLTDAWKKPLQRKERRNKRKEELAAQRTPPKEEQQKLVVHNPALGIQYPPKQHEQFAVIQVDGFQYKVLEDTVLILDTKKDHAINQQVFAQLMKIVFKDVPLVGTKTYTLVGRPNVGCARVEAIVESISASQKVIVFKKKRRKQYKKSFGSRVTLTQCRITKIVHQIQESLLKTAVGLQ